MRLTLRLTSMWLVLFTGCGQQDLGKNLKQGPTKNIVNVADDDARMENAFKTARDTAPQFIDALKNLEPKRSGFAVKMKFTDGAQNEFMWLDPVSFDGKVFTGPLGNEPRFVKNIKMGQVVSIEPGKIADWKYIENQKLIGGFTIRAIRDGMSPAELAKLDARMPFKFD